MGALPTVFYYALGGGHGHVLRGIAVTRALGYGEVIGPARAAPWASTLGVAYRPAPDRGLREWIGSLPAPALLLVDVFPRGVLGELPPFLEGTPAWLVSRWVQPAYYRHAGVRAVIESRYERLLWAETPAEGLRSLKVPATDVGPVLLDLPRLSREEARRSLGVGEDTRLLLALGSGDRERQRLLHRLLGKVAARTGTELRFISDVLEEGVDVVARFPAAPLLAAADVLVTAAGYHAVHEARAAGVPTVYLPQRRRFDDQFRRVEGERVASGPGELERAVHTLLGQEHVGGGPPRDGAGRVARLVQRRVEAGVLGEEEVTAMA